MSQAVLVVLVNYRRVDDTKACIESLIRLATPAIELTVAVCDNGSTVASAEALMAVIQSSPLAPALTSADPASDVRVLDGKVGPHRCVLVLSPKNLGFAGGNNLALHAARRSGGYDYVWFLNNDTEVAPDSLACMLGRMEQDARIGLCGATLVYAWDRARVQCFGGCRLNVWTGATHQIGHGSAWPCDVDLNEVEGQMAYPAGASMLASRRFLDTVGLMVEDYFIFYEEIDWSIRARKAGFRIAYAPDAVVYHKEGASIGTGHSTKRSALAEYFGLRNKLLFTWRFYPWAMPSVWLISWLQVLRRLTQRQWSRAGLMARTLCGLGSVPQH